MYSSGKKEGWGIQLSDDFRGEHNCFESIELEIWGFFSAYKQQTNWTIEFGCIEAHHNKTTCTAHNRNPFLTYFMSYFRVWEVQTYASKVDLSHESVCSHKPCFLFLVRGNVNKLLALSTFISELTRKNAPPFVFKLPANSFSTLAKPPDIGLTLKGEVSLSRLSAPSWLLCTCFLSV